MKLTLITLLITVLGSWAIDSYSQSTRLTIKMDDTSIENVLNKIEDQSEFRFFYNGIINVDQKISVSIENQKIVEVLEDIFKDIDINYKLMGRQIMLSPRSLSPKVSQKQKNISGIVSDQSGSPLPGVTVIIKGTTNGTITDADGNYSLSNIPSDATLVFSFVGMKMQEVAVGGKSTINVTMEEDAIGIEEVVAIGYGTMKRSDLTGAVASVTADIIEDKSATNVLQSIQGSVPGITISQSSSIPGSDMDIYIRGINSISASNEPLVVIDGVPGSLDLINPNDIQSIDILKDASSTAIYGSRGANGVILVTTKRGSGKPKVSYNTYYGLQKATKLLDFMDPEEYIYYRQRFAELGGESDDLFDILTTEEYENYNLGRVTDWQDLIIRDAIVSEHNLSVSGGEKSLNYFLSASYLDHDYIMGDYGLKRKSIRANVDKQFNSWLKVGNNLQITESGTTGSIGGNIYHMMHLPPYSAPTDSDGNTLVYPLESESTQCQNPLATIENGDYNTGKNLITENIFIELQPIEGLKYKANFGYTIKNNKSNSYYGMETAAGRDKEGYALKSTSNSTKWLFENIVNFSKIVGEHAFNFTGLYSAEESSSEGMSADAWGFTNDALLYNSLASATNTGIPESSASHWAMTSIMGRINYNYKGKYMLTFTLRRDGYSAFGENHKYGNFPSAAFAWRVSEEGFMKSIDAVSQLKFRLSWGKNGNQAVSSYVSQAKVGLLNNSYDGNLGYSFGDPVDDVEYGYGPLSLGNSGLGWESTESINFGIDFGLFNNKINGTVEYYHTQTDDLLLKRSLPVTTGYSSIYDNIGKTQNDGIEVSLNTINISSAGGFKWSSSLNFSYNKNQIVDLYGDKEDDTGNSWFIGEPVSVYYNYVFDGIWQEDEDIENSHMPECSPGDIKVKDLSGEEGVPDGDISAAYDRTVVGKKNPDFTWGLTNTFQYKNFDLSFFIHGVHGVTGVTTMHNNAYNSTYMNMLDLDYWLPEKPSNKYITGILGSSKNYRTTMNYCDASYIRLKDVTLGYTFSNNMVEKLGIGIEKIHLYFNATNLITITDWLLWDPATVSGFDSSSNVESGPMTSNFTIGLNVNF